MWLLYACFMFFASNGLYLLIRAASKQNLNRSFYSIFLFLIPSVIYFILALIFDYSLQLSFSHFLMVMVAAFFWSYLGNLFSLRSIAIAPNAGYSLLLQKSYVVLTTIAAVFLFQAELAWHKVFAICIILLFSFVISIDDKKNKNTRATWVYLALLANLCFAFGSLISKYFLTLGLEPVVYLFYINLTVGALNYLDFKRSRVNFSPTRQQLLLACAVGCFSMLFNFSMQLAFKTAPNIGYVSAINVASIMSITLCSAWIFGDALSKTKLLGILGSLFGLCLLLF